MKKLDSSDSSTVLTSNVQQQQQQQIHPQRRRSTQQQGHRTGRREATTTAATTATTTTTTLTSSRNKNRRRRKRSNNNDHIFSSSSIISFEQLLLRYWNLYRRFVHNNHIHLELLDEGICRLLFWMPHHETISSSSGTWREILFGLLSINRLLMDCSQYTKLINSYGTSVEIDQPNIPATSIRIALSVIHCLMPSLLGIMINTTTSNIIKDENDDEKNPNNIIGGEGNTMIMSSSSIQQRQTYLRFCLEQIKFVLRLYLLASYWKQHAEQQQQGGSDSSSLSKKASASASTRSCIPMGILLDGGMFYDNQPQGLSEIERRNLERRFQYVGRRTGLKLPVEITTPQSSSTSSTTSSTARTKTKQTIVAELLYALRPLYWAYNEYKHYHSLQQQDYDCDDVNERQQRRRPSLSLLKGWLTTLTMDMISLRLLSFSQQQQQQQNQSRNRQQHHHWSSKELKRRKMKLFLYLLRSPFWSHITSPMILTKASNLLRNYIPMVGGLIDTCLWDWILYHKQAYVSEEG